MHRSRCCGVLSVRPEAIPLARLGGRAGNAHWRGAVDSHLGNLQDYRVAVGSTVIEVDRAAREWRWAKPWRRDEIAHVFFIVEIQRPAARRGSPVHDASDFGSDRRRRATEGGAKPAGCAE